jgi:hypothetical protein
VRAVGKKRFSFPVWGVGLRQIRCTARGGWQGLLFGWLVPLPLPVHVSISSTATTDELEKFCFQVFVLQIRSLPGSVCF